MFHDQNSLFELRPCDAIDNSQHVAKTTWKRTHSAGHDFAKPSIRVTSATFREKQTPVEADRRRRRLLN